MKKKVFVGISGGVDSAVAASILLEQGYEVHGVFMKNWSGEDYGISDQCPWKEDLEASQMVCEFLGISHRTYNFEKEYREMVIKEFFEEYGKGNTPNPDVLCNKFIKFDAFLERALEEGADLIATGHYTKSKDGKLYKAKDSNKDQTYFLSQVKEDQLEKAMFPLGDMTKAEVRAYAEKKDLPNAKRPDSQGICFIGKIDMNDFLSLELDEKTGPIIDIDTGEVVGTHNGIWFYTLGQRKGLQIGGLSIPYFVCGKDIKGNKLFVASGKKNSALWATEIKVNNFEFINSPIDLAELEDLTGTIRYRSPDTPVTVSVEPDDSSKLTVSFKEAQWAPATGQYLALFQGDQCLGSGIIEIPQDSLEV